MLKEMSATLKIHLQVIPVTNEAYFRNEYEITYLMVEWSFYLLQNHAYQKENGSLGTYFYNFIIITYNYNFYNYLACVQMSLYLQKMN